MNALQARRFYEECLTALYVQREVKRTAEFYTTNIISHPAAPGVPPGIEGLQVVTDAFLSSFSDIHFRIESFTQDGDVFACHLITTGTHTGAFAGIPATGRKVEINDHLRYRFENGKIAEFWSNADIPAVMTQLSGR